MKTGIRKPNIKKSISARTTGKVKRAVKKSVNPMYGKKGAGFVKDPVKSVKSSIYHKTTVGVSDIVKTSGGGSARPAARSTVSGSGSAPAARQRKKGGAASVLMIIFGVLFLIGGVASFSDRCFVRRRRSDSRRLAAIFRDPETPDAGSGSRKPGSERVNHNFL